MHIITRRRLREFADIHPTAKTSLEAWFHIVKRATYRSPEDVRAEHGAADFLSGNRVILNIGGNKYRLVAKIEYRWQKVFIRHVLTHKEYDRLNDAGLL